MLELLRPKPFRGDQVAAGAVVLTVLVALLEVRFAGDWGAGVHLLYAAAATALVLGMAAAAPAEEGGPPAWHSTLYVAGFLLAGATLVNLADVLGSHGGAGTVVWAGAALTALGTWMSRRRDSASGTLLGALAGVVTTLALLDFAFSPHGVTAFRYLLLADALVLALMALWQRIRGPAHGVQLLNAVGLVLLAIAATFLLGLVFGIFTAGLFGRGTGDEVGLSPGTGWTLLVLAGGIGILSAGAADDERGNVVVGSLLLAVFVAMASRGDLRWWPLLLAGATVALLVIGLRPSTPVPDEPPPGAGTPPGRGPGPLPPVRPVE